MSTPPVWCHTAPGGWVIDVHAQPGARRNEIAGLRGDRLKIRIAAPALDGRANEALERFVAEVLDVPRVKVRVVNGGKARDKRIAIDAHAARPSRLLDPG